MTLKDLFNSNKKIIINTDIDGFLSGMILQQYFGCEVVGFSNSHETVWVTPGTSIYEPVYIDLFVNNPTVHCIEQHVIAYDMDAYNTIHGWGTKINPNLDCVCNFAGDGQRNYFHKYPFGTVHYLIYLMEKEGINVTLPAMTYVPQPGMPEFGQVILRADDALFSSLGPYAENAEWWWNQFLGPKSQAVSAMIKYLYGCNRSMRFKYKDDIGNYFISKLHCDDKDGAFSNVVDNCGTILNKVLNYNVEIGKYLNCQLTLPRNYDIHCGSYKCTYADSNFDYFDKSVFSYAFIYGPRSQKPNFSHTTYMK